MCEVGGASVLFSTKIPIGGSRPLVFLSSRKRMKLRPIKSAETSWDSTEHIAVISNYKDTSVIKSTFLNRLGDTPDSSDLKVLYASSPVVTQL